MGSGFAFEKRLESNEGGTGDQRRGTAGTGVVTTAAMPSGGKELSEAHLQQGVRRGLKQATNQIHKVKRGLFFLVSVVART